MRSTSCVGYARVSLLSQAEDGVSLAAQEESIRAYSTMRGFQLIDVVVDRGVSGGKPLSDREGGRRILDAVRARRIAAVVTYKLDRLFRDCGDCLATVSAWDHAGVALHLIDMGGQAIDTGSATGRFLISVVSAAAEMERNLIRERTSSAMKHKKARGEFTGGQPPYGWCIAIDGTLKRVADEQRVIEHAKRLRDTGLSLRAISRSLGTSGARARNGRSFAAQQIANMLKAE